MDRVDTSTAVILLPATEPVGTPGFFTKGDPGSGLNATVPGQDWFNAVQEEILAVIEGATIAPVKADNTQLLAAINALILAAQSGGGGDFATWPAGVLVPVMVAVPPQFTLSLNGQNVLRATFAKLFTAWGTTFGVGDGTTTFGLSDLRGEFLRGWNNASGNDPDAATRTDRGDGTAGDNVGTKQSDELRSHAHQFTAIVSQGALNDWASNANHSNPPTTQATQATGGNETRARNVAVHWAVTTGGEE